MAAADQAQAIWIQGSERHGQGDLKAAIALYDQALILDPDNAFGHMARAMALFSLGDMAGAIEGLDKSIRLDPQRADTHINRGAALAALDRQLEALESYDRALGLDPSLAEVHVNRSAALNALGRHEDALAAAAAALALRPDLPMAYRNQANAFEALGRTEESLVSRRRLLSLDPRDAAGWLEAGAALGRLERNADALEAFEAALRLAPRVAAIHYNLGATLAALERQAEAMEAFNEALRIDPDLLPAHLNRVITLRSLYRLEEALAASEQLLILAPALDAAHAEKGMALHQLGRFSEAIACFERASAIAPDVAHHHNNRAASLAEAGRPEEAVKSFRRAIQLQPDYVDAQLSLSTNLLLLGEFAAGWAGHEWRKKTKFKAGFRPYAEPEWLGGESLEGKTLFVHWELGLGDTLLFCRYLPMVAQLAERVIFSHQDGLGSLMRTLPADIELLGQRERPEHFDFHTPLQSLALAFETDLESIPASIPYLAADPGRVVHWRDKLGEDGFKVGVCWRSSKLGEQLGKSYPLSALESLGRLPGVRLISLQREMDGAEAIASLPPGMTVESLGPDFDTGDEAFFDSAAVMQNLDLVISNDTSTLHLAGALGRPVWAALKFVSDWRWFLHRTDSPWYPSMRLFRQAALDDWTSAFAEMEEALKERLANR